MSDHLATKYQKLNPREHVLKRPTMYIGSVSNSTEFKYILSDDHKTVINEEISYNPGLLKLFDEILLNAVDEYVKGNVTTVEVSYNHLLGSITIADDGGIPVVKHPVHHSYIPEMIFGEFMAGSNFGDERQGAGMNGLGAKLVAVMSDEFTVETDDGKSHFTQVYRKNLSEKSNPIISKSRGKGTVITYVPDYKRFGVVMMPNDGNQKMMARRIHDVAACNPNLVIKYNGERVQFKNFGDYVSMFCGGVVSDFDSDGFSVVVGESKNDTFEHISFVNNIDTYNGGTHINHVLNGIVNGIREYIQKKHKIDIKPNNIKQQLFLGVSCNIDSPSFTSQTKEFLSTEVKDFDKTYSPSDGFIKKLLKSKVVQAVIAWAEGERKRQDEAELKKLDKASKESTSLKRIIKFDDAGSKNRDKCALILTEGDSARKSLISARDPVFHGLYPLKGKPVNVSGISMAKLASNNEFSEMIQILGISPSKKGDISTMRFGKILIGCDSDLDGFHICGLLINMFYKFWPDLIKKGLVYRLKTPLIIATAGKKKHEFFDKPSYFKWAETAPKHSYKYFKGLSSFTSKEMEKYVKDEKNCWVPIEYDDSIEKYISLAFDKTRANDRKTWLETGVDDESL